MSVKSDIRILIGIPLNLYVALSHIDTNNINSSNPRTQYTFPCIGSVCNLVYQCLIVFSVPIFLVKSISECFILLGVILNGIIFLIYLFDGSLLLYRNATDFGVFILYPGTLLKLFFQS